MNSPIIEKALKKYLGSKNIYKDAEKYFRKIQGCSDCVLFCCENCKNSHTFSCTDCGLTGKPINWEGVKRKKVSK